MSTLRLTLRSLTGVFRSSVSDTYVCENPSVLVAAADALGPRSYPLICTSGRPSAAGVRLLTRLAETGTSLHIRADDDTVGREIVKALTRTAGRPVMPCTSRALGRKPGLSEWPIGASLASAG